MPQQTVKERALQVSAWHSKTGPGFVRQEGSRPPELPARLSFSRATSKAPPVVFLFGFVLSCGSCWLPSWSVFGSSCLCSLHRLVPSQPYQPSQQPELERDPRECRLLGALFHASSRPAKHQQFFWGAVSLLSCVVVALPLALRLVRVWLLLSLLPAKTYA